MLVYNDMVSACTSCAVASICCLDSFSILLTMPDFLVRYLQIYFEDSLRVRVVSHLTSCLMPHTEPLTVYVQ